jgi:hypothetical protein
VPPHFRGVRFPGRHGDGSRRRQRLTLQRGPTASGWRRAKQWGPKGASRADDLKTIARRIGIQTLPDGGWQDFGDRARNSRIDESRCQCTTAFLVMEIAVKIIRTFVAVAAVTAALTLSACGSATTSSTSTSPEPSVSREAAPIPLMGSFSHYFAVENQLTGIPVTWKVSETVNRHWDGNSRPDHRPPDGLRT